MATELRVAAQEGTEPKYVVAGDHIAGLCIDIMRAVERIDHSLKFVGDQVWMPQVRTYSEVVNGAQDAMCGVQHTAERDQQYIFLEPSLFPIYYKLIARADDPVVINNWDDVRKLGAQGVILASRNHATTNILAELGGLQVDASSASPALNLHKLVSGRGRFFVHRTPGLQAFLVHAGVAGKVRILPADMYHTKLYMIMGRHVDPAVTARVRYALAQLDKNGELDRLLLKWE